MSIYSPATIPSGFRHRIQEISLPPIPSAQAIKLEVHVDNKLVHILPTISSSHSLRWNMQIFPCDVQPESRVTIRVIEKHRWSTNRVRVAEYQISAMAGQTTMNLTTSISTTRPPILRSSSKPTINSDPVAVTLTFPSVNEVESEYTLAYVKAKEIIENERGPLGALGNVATVFKTILDFGVVVAELSPAAKLVVSLCTKTWEHLEKFQRLHDDMQKLINGLTRILPFLDFVKEHSKETLLKETILALLNFIEDVSNFIIEHLSDSPTERFVRGFVDGNSSERVSALLQQFEGLKEDFDRSVRVRLLSSVLTSAQRALVDRLNPASRSHYANTQPCQKGTREQLLGGIDQWAQTRNTGKQFCWIYGQAGFGKSSIAASICARLESQGTPTAHFFCKRDDPDLRNPERALNTIVHQLAVQYVPYGHAIADAIAKNAQLPNLPFRQRYVHLIERPLEALRVENVPSPSLLVVVVDAIDECEKGSNRQLLLSYLQRMSRLTSWLKVVVTSRPDPDVKTSFEKVDPTCLVLHDLLDHDASDDIYAFTQSRMNNISLDRSREKWSEHDIRLLSERAGGLFVWAEAACRFISNGSDMDSRFRQILEGTQSVKGTQSLDQLYTTAIQYSMGDDDEDNVQNVRRCIGAIVATGNRTPLSVSGLEKLLSGYVNPGVFREVVRSLSSVLYEDHKKKDAVRVYHPSFADYVTNESRSGSFYVDLHEQNIMLADHCLCTMLQELEFNICGLETSYAFNRDVPGLDLRVETKFTEHLKYSCMHWASHLVEASIGDLEDRLSKFLLGPTLLYWIEALSLLKKLNIALSSLLELVEWTSRTMSKYLKCANDAYRFILAFYDAISESTPHLYISALPLAPRRSKIAKRMRLQFPNTFEIKQGAYERWSAWLQIIQHDDAVNSVAISPNGHRIIAGCKDKKIRVWDAETGAAVSDPLIGHTNAVTSVAISPGGRRVASGSRDRTVRIWDTETSTEVFKPLIGHTGSVTSVAFSPNGRYIASSSNDKTVRMWDADTGNSVPDFLIRSSTEIACVAYSPNGQHLALGLGDGTVHLWDIESKIPLFSPLIGHSSGVSSAAFSPNGRHLVSGSLDKTLRIWDVETGSQVLEPLVGHLASVQSVAYSPNGIYIISGSSDNTVRIWDANTGAAVSDPLIGHSSGIKSVAFTPNSRRIVSGSLDNTVRIWDVEVSGENAELPFGHSSGVSTVALSPNGVLISSGSDDHTVQIWDAQTGGTLSNPLTGHTESIRCLAFSPTSRQMISGSEDNTARIWDLKPNNYTCISILEHSDTVMSVAYSPNGAHVVSGSLDKTLRIWDAITGDPASAPLVGHSAGVNCVAFSPDNKRIFSVCAGCEVRVWDAETGAAISELLAGHLGVAKCIAFSPDCRLLTLGFKNHTVKIWDWENDVVSEPLAGHQDAITAVAFSPDSSYVVSGSADKTMRVWDVATGIAVSEPLVGHSSRVRSVAFSPDCRRIASGSNDRTIRIWDSRVGETEVVNFSDSFVSITHSPTGCKPTSGSVNSLCSLSTSHLARHLGEHGWVTPDQGDLLLWLPAEYRHIDDSSLRISAMPLPCPQIDFTNFVHGESWTLVAGPPRLL